MTYNAILDVVRSGFGSEVITLAEVKANIGVDFTDFDGLITDLIAAVREQTESYCGVSIVEQVVTVRMMNGLGNQYLPYGPVVGDVTSIEDTNEVAIEDAVFRGANFPRLVTSFCEEVTLVYNTGYGSDVPKDLKLAMIQEVCYQFEHRGDEDGIPSISGQYKAKANKYRRNKWAM